MILFVSLSTVAFVGNIGIDGEKEKVDNHNNIEKQL